MAEKEVKSTIEGAPSNVTPSLWSDLLVKHRFRISLVVHNILFALALLMAYLVWFEAAESGGANAKWFTERFLIQLPLFLLAKT